MKKKFTFCYFALLLFTGVLHAQRGFTITAAAGGGGSGLLTGGSDLTNGNNSEAPMTVTGRLNACYRLGRFSVVTGIQYFTSGFDQYINIPVGSEPQVLAYSFTFRNILLPVSLQLHMPMGQWFELLPSAGLGISYTGHALYEIAIPVPDRKVLSSNDFKAIFRRYNAWGVLSLQLACNFYERMARLGGFEMLGNVIGIEKTKPADRAALRLLAGNVNLAFQYKFYQ
jgi:hypothetical protein